VKPAHTRWRSPLASFTDHHPAIEESHAGDLLVLVQTKARQVKHAADQSPYLGTAGSVVMGAPTWLPLRCQVE